MGRHQASPAGNHIGPIKTPSREDDPRAMPPNFYYNVSTFTEVVTYVCSISHTANASCMRLMQPDQACVFVDCSLKTTALRGGLPICCTHAAAAHCPKRRHSECCMHKPQASAAVHTDIPAGMLQGGRWGTMDLVIRQAQHSLWLKHRQCELLGCLSACRVSRLGTAYLQLQHR